jgi:hypothetical protein
VAVGAKTTGFSFGIDCTTRTALLDVQMMSESAFTPAEQLMGATWPGYPRAIPERLGDRNPDEQPAS